MTIRHLRIFIAVADCGKMNAAAKQLYISQPTVSQAIKELEEHYNMLLFERLGKKLHITENGKELLYYARSIVKQFDDMEEKIFESSYVKKIRIGATLTVGNCILGNVIKRFEELNPKTEVYSYINNTKNIEEKLLQSELDIGIVEGKITNQNLIAVPLVNDHLVLVCSAKHPLAQKKNISLSELENERFAMREEGSGTRALFESYMHEHGVPIKVVVEGSSIDVIKKAIIENQCLSVISIRLVEEEIKKGEIHVIPYPESSWNRYFSVVYHKNKVISNDMNTLFEIIKNYKNVGIFEDL
ncbi:MAG: LysR family transcriptional regulator [Clostridiaceae bacterium]|jgi:DNA-binding transcriptional LysR family regulator|nr:LysR family transcriptional regulator [Clostridiaceae bacterium]